VPERGHPRTLYLAPLALVVLVAAIAALFFVHHHPGSHRISAIVPEATNLIPGSEIRSGRAKVGAVDAVEPVDRGRAARVTFRIDDDAAWPLERSSRFELRWAGTAAFNNRYVMLLRGKPGSATFDEGATVPARNVTVPVEFDGLLRAFDRSTRAGVRALVAAGGANLAVAGAPLRQALTVSPPAVREVSGVIGDVVSEPDALDSLLVSTDHVVDAIHRADPDLRTLLSGAGATFAAIGAQADDLEATLDHLPATLGQTRSTLVRANATLAAVGRVAVRVGPGVRQARALASPLNTALRTLDEVGPDARAALATTRRAAPDLTRLLRRATAISPQLASIGRQATTEVGCLRPYAPELAAFPATWTGAFASTDGKDKIFRLQAQVNLGALSNDTPYTPADAVKLMPQIRYAFPRPPGLNAGQPWFQPQCGVGREVLDPAADQEAKTFGKSTSRGKGGG